MQKAAQTLIILLCLLTHPITQQAQPLQFYQNQFEKAKTEAHNKHHILLVYTYADWCAPCKMMDREVFPATAVVDFHNNRFTCCKIDVESKAGKAFEKIHSVNAVPTLFYFDSDFKLLYKKTGAASSPNEFITHSQAALDISKADRVYGLIENPKSLFLYSYFLKEEGLDYSSCLNQYLNTQEDWFAPDPMRIILDLAEDKDSLAINHFVTHIDSFQAVFGIDKVHEKRMLLVLDLILEFLDNSNQKPDFNEAAPIFKRYFGAEEYLEHLLLFKFRYHQQHEDRAAMRQTLQQFIKEVVALMPDGKDKAMEYIQAAATFYDLSEGKEELQQQAFFWGELAAQLHSSYDIFNILSILYENAGNSSKAKYYQNKAQDLLRKD